MKHNSRLCAMAIGAALAATITMTAQAGDAPAVSGVNAKAAISGTYVNDDTTSAKYGGLLSGSVTAPISHEFGFQADGVVGKRRGDTVAGVGGHFFWREPTTGLVGVTASYLNVNVGGTTGHLSVARVGGEGEFYSGPFTVAFQSGYQNGHHVDDGYYGSLTGYWYPDENLRLGIGAANDPTRDTTGLADVEFMPGLAGIPGLSLFANGRLGKNSYATAQVGVRFYFGQGKSLKARNREDDPIVNLPDGSYGETPTSQGSECPAGYIRILDRGDGGERYICVPRK